MKRPKKSKSIHPTGEVIGSVLAPGMPSEWVDTFGGRLHVTWDPDAAVTPLGQLPYFVAFLKAAGLYEPWVEECPLTYTSPNAPPKRDIVGTLVLSVLSGHRRYAHITAMRGDGVSPVLLGMEAIRSEDAVRRAFQGADTEACAAWQRRHLEWSYGLLLQEPWVLDMDTTVKPVYGHQEGAVVGYNPAKPGRPSHAYHTYFVAALRLVLEVEVQAGNRTASAHSRPGLWALLDRLGRDRWPRLVRGDCAWGQEAPMRECEERRLAYLFKLRQTGSVRRLIRQVYSRRDWEDAGQGWQGVEDRLQLMGWSQARRLIVLRRRIPGDVALVEQTTPAGQGRMVLISREDPVAAYEYAVLVTTVPETIESLAQLYRDRADAENAFDELKNHWGWGGYRTQDLARCQIMARIVAQVYNWWSLFVRLVIPTRHAEALTSRPLLLQGVGRLTRHAGQNTLTITSTHGKHRQVRTILLSLQRLFRALSATAEQLTPLARWSRLLSIMFRAFWGGRVLHPSLRPLESG
jgi:hypothetical protein